METRQPLPSLNEPPLAPVEYVQKPSKPRYWLHVLLFILTLATTTTIWGFWSAAPVADLSGLLSWMVVAPGLIFSVSLLTFLTVHEFGHYFAAKHHNIDATLPYYIPLPFIGIGTLGAVIRIKSPIPSRKKLFDIGASGPLAGFIVAIVVLFVALATLPPVDAVNDFAGHDELKDYVARHQAFPDEMPQPADGQTSTIVVGQTILFWAASQLFEDVPPMYEMYHYPMLFAAWLGLFFTALNMLPVGQLDGGHILYSLVGPKWHARIARTFVVLLLISGSIGLMVDQTPGMLEIKEFLGPFIWFALAGVLFVYLNKIFNGNHKWIAPVLLTIVLISVASKAVPDVANAVGYSGWLIWCLLIVFLIKVEHPPVYINHSIDTRRKVLGIVSFLIFVLCFSIRPIAVV